MSGNHCNYCVSCVLLMAEDNNTKGGARMRNDWFEDDNEIRSVIS